MTLGLRMSVDIFMSSGENILFLFSPLTIKSGQTLRAYGKALRSHIHCYQVHHAIKVSYLLFLAMFLYTYKRFPPLSDKLIRYILYFLI